jgi:hypothetical protein
MSNYLILAISPESTENLIALGWFMGTVLCLAAVATVRDWAKRFRNNWLLLLMAPPGAVLAYEACLFLKAVVVGIVKAPLMDWLTLVAAIFTWYFLVPALAKTACRVKDWIDRQRST